MRFLQSMLDAFVDPQGRIGVFGKKLADDAKRDPHVALRSVLAAQGEVSSLAYAGALFDQIEKMDDAALVEFVDQVASTYDIDAAALADAAQKYGKDDADGKGIGPREIARLAEPQWLEMFRRLNAIHGGTARLVHLRKRLLDLTGECPAAAKLEAGLKSLLRMWFNPGFLMLEPIDWSTSANVLEKIIAYESVHEISSWSELRARLAPEDRRCFAFFHPLMPEEPLIFVQVALTADIPAGIDEVIGIDHKVLATEKFNTAVFYSISNCQAGLAGISFGNFLIKRVARELRHEIESINTFVTLSPVPDLMRWLEENTPDLARLFFSADDSFWEAEAEELRDEFLDAALDYFTRSTRKDGMPNDRVARFHIGNGAVLEGLMVNYLYDLDKVEANHEEFHETMAVPLSSTLKAQMKSTRAKSAKAKSKLVKADSAK